MHAVGNARLGHKGGACARTARCAQRVRRIASQSGGSRWPANHAPSPHRPSLSDLPAARLTSSNVALFTTPVRATPRARFGARCSLHPSDHRQGTWPPPGMARTKHMGDVVCTTYSNAAHALTAETSSTVPDIYLAINIQEDSVSRQSGTFYGNQKPRYAPNAVAAGVRRWAHLLERRLLQLQRENRQAVGFVHHLRPSGHAIPESENGSHAMSEQDISENKMLMLGNITL